MPLIPLINNISLLIALSLVSSFVFRFLKSKGRYYQLINGVLFGVVCVVGMMNPMVYASGIIFDGRSIILAVAGAFGGPFTAAVGVLIAGTYRAWLGGAGMLMGLLVILESGLLGVLFYALRRKYPELTHPAGFFVLGLLVHIIMLVLTIAIPGRMTIEVLNAIFIPVLVLYPMATLVVCMLYHNQEKHQHTLEWLWESEDRFRQLFLESPAIMLVISPESGRIIDANQAAERFYGWSVDELRLKRIHDINTLDDVQLHESIQMAMSRRQNHFFFKHRQASGLERHVEVHAGPVSLRGGQALFSIIQDISQRVLIEQSLKASEASYRDLFNAIEDGVYLQDQQGRFLDVNKGGEKLFGYSRRELLTQTPEFLSAPGMNDSRLIAKLTQKAFEGVPQTLEFWGQKKNGSVFPLNIRMFKGRYKQEDVLISLAEDITEKKTAEQIIQESRANLKVLINISEDVIVLLDKKGQIITCNERFAKIYHDVVPLLGRNIFEIIPRETYTLRKNNFDKVLKSGQMVNFEDIAGGIHWWSTYYPIRDSRGKVERVALYARDMTSQRELFELHKNLEVARNATRIKQQFLANMSHEMRTPMNGILGMTQLLQKTNLDDRQTDYLNTIHESAQTLLLLINDVLDLSRIESGKMPLDTSSVDVQLLKGKIKGLYTELARAKGLEFIVDFSDAIPPFILGDEKRILQVITNLVGNALKFTPKGSIVVRAFLGPGDAQEFELRFEVEDTGIGIGEQQQRFIFEEFTQTDDSRTRQFEGSGLGLAISKKLVELMKGRIGVSSQLNAGSIFWFTMRTAEAEPVIMEKTLVEPEAPLDMRVLLVEDKAVNRKVAGLILGQLGCQVDYAENGRQGVEKILEGGYDLVLMDIQMPVMDGVTATHEIRRKMLQAPVIIGLSAEAMEGDAERYKAEGMDDYLTKPLIPHELYQRLRFWKEQGQKRLQ